MITFFEYNWQVRDEWFEWSSNLTREYLVEKRVGGVESILYTLFHIVEVESSWIRGIQGKEEILIEFKHYNELEKVKKLSDTYRKEIINFLKSSLYESSNALITVPWDEDSYSKEDILHHIIAHEIHYIGQLSIWAREIGLKPISTSFIERERRGINHF
ncbi:DinB family protein [Bacillus carboniphilus]|uniref:DinB family protein n=1 Tax=Bacillus carboniphilus TaxID=86663 RepID=A0ABY9JSP6_9BACI|nr:DinB family protein [Bacillus carboniphilus]WLR42426.1 DinB family protein [Bacillus carboniphilus]